MQIKLYVNHSEKEKVNKVLTNELILTGEKNGDCPLLEPNFIITGDIIGYNYAIIPDFNRRYFLGEPVNIGGNDWLVPMMEDYLSTWWDSVKSNNAIVERQENQWDMYLNDGTFKFDSTDKTATIFFPNNLLTTPSYVFSVAGDYDFVEG